MEEIKKIPSRDQIPAEDKWAIEDLYPTDEAWEAELAALAESQKTLASFAGRLGESGETLYAYMEVFEQVNAKGDLLGSYCMRRADEDTRNATYQAMAGKFMGVAVALNAACSFDTPEIMAISDEKLAQFYAECPKLERYRRYLTNLRRRKAHTLSAAEEKLLASAGEMSQAPDTIYGSLADADLKFPDAVDVKGNKHPLTQGTFVSLEESSDRVLRQSAYENLYGTLAAFKTTTAALLNAQNKQLKFFAEARKYDTAFEASLDATNVPTSVYKNLIETVHQNMDKMHRYVRLRKKLLGVDELHMYDVYTPIVADADQAIPYEQAKETVLEALQVLGEDYVDLLKEGFSNRWIDVYENIGKRSGAYSSGNSRPHPYVLLNHKDNLDCQFTLAHEMGHALHSYHSCKYQPVSTSDYVIFVAEVASTCNEVLLMRHLLKKTTDKKQRAYLINHFMDQFKGTVYRQTMFAEFELAMGKMAESGQALTADALCQKYHELNKLYFGPDMVSDDQIALEWARIPHFFYNYYVFQYATGFSAAVAIANRILKEGAPAVADYKKFLSGGCSTDPISLLKIAGVDMSSPEPVNSALALFGELVDEMEQLV